MEFFLRVEVTGGALELAFHNRRATERDPLISGIELTAEDGKAP